MVALHALLPAETRSTNGELTAGSGRRVKATKSGSDYCAHHKGVLQKGVKCFCCHLDPQIALQLDSFMYDGLALYINCPVSELFGPLRQDAEVLECKF